MLRSQVHRNGFSFIGGTGGDDISMQFAFRENFPVETKCNLCRQSTKAFPLSLTRCDFLQVFFDTENLIKKMSPEKKIIYGGSELPKKKTLFERYRNKNIYIYINIFISKRPSPKKKRAVVHELSAKNENFL